jgi:hypothetical protein
MLQPEMEPNKNNLSLAFASIGWILGKLINSVHQLVCGIYLRTIYRHLSGRSFGGLDAKGKIALSGDGGFGSSPKRMGAEDGFAAPTD